MRESLRRLASYEGMETRRLGAYRRVRIELTDGEHFNLDIDVSKNCCLGVGYYHQHRFKLCDKFENQDDDRY